MSKGIDVSAYQPQVDWNAVRDAGYSFAACKVTEGVGFVDSSFATHWAGIKAAGMRRIAYHFARPDLGNSPFQEAEFFIGTLGGLEPDDFVALDYEADWDGEVVEWCHNFLEHVRAETDRAPLLYLNLSLVRAFDWSTVVAAGFPLWLALYGANDGEHAPAIPTDIQWPAVALHQWTSVGKVPGIAGVVDVNEAFGEFAVMETAEQTYDRIAPLVQEKVVAPQADTNKAIKDALGVVQEAVAALATKVGPTGDHVSDAELREIATKLGVALEKIGASGPTP